MELKPKFQKSSGTLIKATQPFQKLNIDFKVPLPSSATGSKYMLTLVDEYSRFPFAFPCRNMSRYNPRGNGQCERYNGIIWQAITLALKSSNLTFTAWEQVLPDALHSIRSLLCTTTNATPHERLFNFNRKSTSGNSFPSCMS